MFVCVRCYSHAVVYSLTSFPPDIAQWSVLAIRNLCEDNPANQRLIASLRVQGVCPVEAEALEASGGVVEVGEDGRVRVSGRKRD